MSHLSDDFDMWVVQLDPALVGSCWRGIEAAVTRAADVDGDVDVDLTVSLFDRWPILLGERLAGRATVDVGASEMEALGHPGRCRNGAQRESRAAPAQ
jgi:hypothetical protein